MRFLFLLMTMLCLSVPSTQAEEAIELHAAGSLKAALSAIADAFEKDENITVHRNFGPSGLLRQRIADGEKAQVFASANMKHPQALAQSGMAGPVVLFTRNRLCALAQPGVDVATESLLDVLLDPAIRVGTSTPKADPAGDYAWAMFDRAEQSIAGAAKTLRQKALQLTGGPDSPSPPEGKNPYAWVMAGGKADIFLSYCTNAVLAQREVPELAIIALPETLAIGADYGLTVMRGAPENAWRLAFYILSPKAQEILASFGFAAANIPE